VDVNLLILRLLNYASTSSIDSKYLNISLHFERFLLFLSWLFFIIKFQKMRLQLHFAILFSAAIDTSNAQSSIEPRRIQQNQTFNYRANYTVDFQQRLDPSCEVNAPILNITCRSRNMTIIGTSDDSIVCNQVDVPFIDNYSLYQCFNTCNGIECENVYLSTGGDSSAGPFGSIQFACEANSASEVGALVYSISTGGICNSNATIETRTLHV
jgi:hypothetical protein